MAGPEATHRFLLPGRYLVTAVLALGAGSARLHTEVQVQAAPAALELVCLASVHSGETLQLGLRNRGGSGLEAAYSIMALGEEPARGGAARLGQGVGVGVQPSPVRHTLTPRLPAL